VRIGQSQLRHEDDRLLRGAGRFTGDLAEEGAAAMVLVRSPVAAGTIRSLDVAAARAMPGVLAVLTGAEMAADGVGGLVPRLLHPGPDGGPMRVPSARPLATEAVHYVGEPVAAVIAETRAEAEDAAEAVELDIDERPAVVDPLAAAAPDAPRVWEDFPDNRCFRYEQGDCAAVEAALAGAAHVAEARLRVSRVTAAPLEPRSLIAAFDPATGRYRLDIGTQAPHRVAGDLAGPLGVEAGAIRVVAHDCGGSFGMKNGGYPEYLIALWSARRLGRPVRWQSSRLEAFQSDAHGRDQWADARLALDAEGRFLGLAVHVHAGLGAVLGAATPHPPTANVGGLAGVYTTPAIHVVVEGMFTNTQQTAPYRGAGRPEATYVIERMIDIAAAETGIDRVTLRRRNLIPPEAMPYRTGLVLTYDSGDFPAVLDRALAAADWDGFEARRAEARARGRLRGIGIANPIEIAGGPADRPLPEFARLELAPDGGARLLAGCFDTGQGHATAFRAILADRLGLDPLALETVTGDTDRVRRGTGTFGSRTMAAAGTAFWQAMDAVVETLRPEAAEALEVDPADLVFDHGAYSVAGTDRSVAFAEVLARHGAAVAAERFVAADDATFPNGCHVCEVEVDPETGGTEVVAYTVVDDVGTVINPLLVKGQIAGGVAQGLGQALMEDTAYQDGTGQILGATFMDYALPRATDLPGFAVESHPVPTAKNPLGVKGAGEAGTVGALAAVVSAVCDALAPAGVRHLDMPATPARVWAALQAASGEAARHPEAATAE
jgi:aerobic carbon-monoxide dehydrogenase large subunit